MFVAWSGGENQGGTSRKKIGLKQCTPLSQIANTVACLAALIGYHLELTELLIRHTRGSPAYYAINGI